MKLSEILKEKTTPAHKQAEDGLPFFKPSFTQENYVGLLQNLLSLYEPLEKKIADLLKQESALELDIRMNKANWLKADLRELRAKAPENTTSFPEIPNSFQALGVLYVIEGSSLGGQVIAKNFATRLGLSEAQTQFFKGYGPQTGVMWQRFKAFLDSRDLNSTDTDQVIEGANKAFVFITNSMR